jgi:signal recognition particle GTPase
MNELTKVKRVMQKKLLQRLPHDVLLVLDGSTGQTHLNRLSSLLLLLKLLH